MPIRDTPQNFPFSRISLYYFNSGGISRSEGTLVIKVQVPGVDVNKLSHFQRRLRGWLHKGHFREPYMLPPVPGWQWYCHKMDAYCVECLPCIYETRQAFVAYIACPCGSPVPFSKNRDAESQPEKVTWESIVRTIAIYTSAINWGREPEKGTCSGR